MISKEILSYNEILNYIEQQDDDMNKLCGNSGALLLTKAPSSCQTQATKAASSML